MRFLPATTLATAMLLPCASVRAADTVPEPTKIDVQATLEALDTNHDGVISKKEAAKMEIFRTGFGRLDKNHDGKLDARELEAASIVPEPEKVTPDGKR